MTATEEIKAMIDKARKAQAYYATHFDQDDCDNTVKLVTRTIFEHAEELAKAAVEETKMGVYEDKVSKNRNKSKGIWYDLKGKKSMGMISIDERTGLIEIAKPIGVVAGVVPMTNPIVTPMSKISFALKTKNAIIISPHPKAKNCSTMAVKLILKAIEQMEVPDGMVQVIEEPTLEKTQALMALCDVTVATGGMAMVKSAYSSGKPSFGVGAGNVQVILDRNIEYPLAISKVITGRSFDNGIICSGDSVPYREDGKDVYGKWETLLDTRFNEVNLNEGMLEYVGTTAYFKDCRLYMFINRYKSDIKTQAKINRGLMTDTVAEGDLYWSKAS